MNASRTIPIATLLIVASLTYLIRPPATPPPPPQTQPAGGALSPPPAKPASPFVVRHGQKHYGGSRCPACEYKEIIF